MKALAVLVAYRYEVSMEGSKGVSNALLKAALYVQSELGS
jgi:hypothetical protein